MPKIKCPGCGAEIDTETGLAEVPDAPAVSQEPEPELEPEPLPHPAAARRVNRYKRS